MIAPEQADLTRTEIIATTYRLPGSVRTSVIRVRQTRAAKIECDAQWHRNVLPFEPPWWLRGGHAQTLAGALWPARLPKYRAVARPVVMHDGDAVIVHDDCPTGWRPGDRAALLAHGLGGSSLSPLLVRLVEKLNQRGVRVFRLDMRGCGAGANLARRPYHAGRSDDLAEVVRSVLGWCDAEAPSGVETPLVLFGVSLSGNILLKYLGENPEQVPSQVTRAIAVNPPIDLARSVSTLSGPINRWYDRHFVGSLGKHLAEHLQRFPDAHTPCPRTRPRRMHEFDDWYTAPMGGFENGAEYYQRCSAAQFIPGIQVPTTILTSRDDPMVPVETFEAEQSSWPDTVRLTISNGGGHVGYIARKGLDPDIYWLDWRVVEFVMAGQQANLAPDASIISRLQFAEKLSA